ncbi:MAG: hypothetical protein ACLUOC_04340, partial [Peptoniphilaceae bacterium]
YFDRISTTMSERIGSRRHAHALSAMSVRNRNGNPVLFLCFVGFLGDEGEGKHEKITGPMDGGPGPYDRLRTKEYGTKRVEQ